MLVRSALLFGLLTALAIAEPRVKWGPPRVIPDRASADVPALITMKGKVHMVFLGRKKPRLYHCIYNGTDWSAATMVPGIKASRAPGLTEFGGKLHMVSRGEKSQALYHQMFDGTAWTSAAQIHGSQSRASPALVTHHSKMHMVYLDEDDGRLWHRTHGERGWDAPTLVAGHTANARPTLVSHEGVLVLFYVLNRRGDLMSSIWDGRGWQGAERVRSGVVGMPAVVSVNKRIHLVVLADGTGMLETSHFNGRAWSIPVVAHGQQSRGGAGIAPSGAGHHGALFHVCYLHRKGKSLWHSKVYPPGD